jgi:hypothetical protein
MARTVSDWLRDADDEARRWVRSQRNFIERETGFPKAAPFAVMIARGNVPPPTPPEDETLMRVGQFLWSLNEIQRRVIASHYDDEEGYAMPIKARRLGITVHRFRHLKERALTGLAGYLMAFR